MAKPDLDDGFLQLSTELLAGLADTPAVVGLRLVVILEVWFQQYGWAKHSHAQISPADIAKRKGLKDDSGVTRAIRELVAYGVLERVGRGMLRFVKDHEKYDFGETPETRAARCAYAAHAPSMVKLHKYRPMENQGGETDTIAPQKGAELTPKGGGTDPKRVSELTPKGGGTDTISGPPHTPLMESISRGDIYTEVVVEGEATGTKVSESIPTDDPTSDVKALARWAESLAPMEDGPRSVETWAASGFPLDWIRDAVLCGIFSAKPGGAWQYANGCLRRWRRRGSVDVAEVQAATTTTGPATFAPRLAPLSMADRRRQERKEQIRRLKEREALNGHG